MALLSLESFGLRREQGRLVPIGGTPPMTDAAVTLIYVDTDGNEVPEGDVRAVKQYRSDDPARPNADKPTKPAQAEKAVSGPAEDKAVKAPKATKAK